MRLLVSGATATIRALLDDARYTDLARAHLGHLLAFPPCFLNEPWKLRACLSYCDTRVHQGTIYRAAGFELVRTNEDGVQTWVRGLRGLQGHERKLVERESEVSPRSQRYRAQRAQLPLPF